MSVDPELVGVIGGSGFYELLSEGQEIVVDTPYGPPAGPITVGTLSEQRVAFLPRHGADQSQRVLHAFERFTREANAGTQSICMV